MGLTNTYMPPLPTAAFGATYTAAHVSSLSSGPEKFSRRNIWHIRSTLSCGLQRMRTLTVRPTQLPEVNTIP